MASDPSPVRLGRYAILRQIGSGGSADVYEALDTSLNRPVALKVLHAELADEKMVERLHREAAAVAKFRHPNIVAVHDVGEADGAHFIAMDLIRGGTLADAFPRWPLKRRLEAVETVGRAVHAAHEHGIIHRDLKPHNVLVDSTSGQIFLTDFGLARNVDSRTLTRSGSALGTPYYMAPEQVRGDKRLIKPTTDVWALGVMLYEALAERPPFGGQTALEVYDSILRREPRPIRNVAPDLATVCLKALEKDPFRRYPSAKAFADDLHRAINGEPILARPVSVTYRLLKGLRRNPLPVAASAVFLATAAVAGLIIVSQRSRERASTRAEAEQLLASLPQDRRAAMAALIRADHLARSTGDPDLRYAVNRRLGDLALAGSNFDVARLAFTYCDATHPSERLTARVDDRERGEARRRKERIDAALADLRAGLRRADRPPGAPLLDDYVFECVQYNDDQTVSLLADALAPFAAKADRETRWLQEERDLMTFAFRVLGRIDRDSALAPLALLMGVLWDPALAAECGSALCNTRRSGADAPLLAARNRLDVNSAAWRQIQRLYARVPADGDAAEPKTAAQFNARGLARQQRGDLDGSIADYTRALELDPVYVFALVNRGNARDDKRDYRGALADFDRAIEIDPSDHRLFNNRGNAKSSLNDFQGAIEDITHAIELEPRNAIAFNNRGNARRHLGDLDGAIADYDQAIQLSPDEPLWWNTRGNARRDKRDFAGAIADCDQAIRLGPRNSQAFMDRGTARRLGGDLEGALADFTHAIELNPRNVTAIYYRAFVRYSQNDDAAARADYDRVIELDPKHAIAHDNRGALRARQGDYDGAIKDLTRAIELSPPGLSSLFNRALARRLKGDLAGAVQDWERWLELAPKDSPQAAAVRDTLRQARTKLAERH